jgi:phospholipid/cholesterol/gamma-HCH transport system substrate-binding protein
MTFKFRYTDRIVGIFVFVSIFILFSIIMIVILNQKIFERKFRYVSRFEDAYDLKSNQDVYFKGFKIGKIEDFKLNDRDSVDVDFFIFRKFQHLVTRNSVLNKSSNPLTGSKIVLIQNELNADIAPEHSYIPSLDTDEGKLLVAQGAVKKQADKISDIINTVDEILKSVNSDNNAGSNSVARILVNTADTIGKLKDEMDRFDIILGNFQTLSGEMKNPDNLVRRLLDPDGEVMFNSINKSLDSLTRVMDNLETFSVFIDKQTGQIESLMVETKSTMKELRDVLEGLKNNPLIKGGITDKKEQEKVKESIREKDF